MNKQQLLDRLESLFDKWYNHDDSDYGQAVAQGIDIAIAIIEEEVAEWVSYWLMILKRVLKNGSLQSKIYFLFYV